MRRQLAATTSRQPDHRRPAGTRTAARLGARESARGVAQPPRHLDAARGVVGACDPSADPRLRRRRQVDAYGGEPPAGAPAVGARVVVYPIITCGRCPACLADEPLGCRFFRMLSEPPLGGALAEYVEIPAANLGRCRTRSASPTRVPAHRLPDRISGAVRACGPAPGHERPGARRYRGRGQPRASCSAGSPASPSTPPRATKPSGAFAVDLGAEAAFPVERETARAVIGATGGLGGTPSSTRSASRPGT